MLSRIRNVFSNPGSRDKKSLLNDSAAFCMAPFVHQNVAVHGEVFPCCVAAVNNLDKALGNLKEGDTLKQCWNSKNSMQLRNDLLNDKKNPLCRLCYEWESVGKESTRQFMNKKYAKFFHLVEATDDNGYLEQHELAYLDLRLSNLCNLKCRICTPYLSSAWYSDAIKMDIIDEDWAKTVKPFEDTASLFEQLEPLLPRLEKIHFAGGEPLITDHHNTIVQYLIENDLTHIELSYNTNFSRLSYKKVNFIDVWKKFKKVTVCASLDGTGQRGEFMRKGLIWDDVISLRQQMLKETPHVYFEINPTVGILNMWHMPDFFREWVDEGLLKLNQLNLYYLFEPEGYNVRRLPSEFKKEIAVKYREFIDDYLKPKGQKANKAVGQFENLLEHMFKEDLPMLEEFYDYNDKLDEIREEDLWVVFPELKVLKKEV